MHLLGSSLKRMAKLTFQPRYFRFQQKPKTDLYQILGVNKNADATQIKKAYYKKAQEYHPDKNPSPEAKQKFTVINNAYEILSDSSKRQMYDQTGQTGQGNAAEYNNYHSDGQGFNPEDIFEQFRGQRGANQNMGGFEDIFEDLFGGQFQQKRGRAKHFNQQFDNSPITMNMVLNFEQSVKGATKVIELDRKCMCSVCNGKKSRPGTEPEKCRPCGGSGTQTFRQGMFVMKTPCESCGGEGTKIKHLCTSCKGKGFQKKRISEAVEIPKGVSDGMTIKLTGKGHFGGDLFLKIQVRKSPVFRRVGANALSDLHISVIDAILGAEKTISTIEGLQKSVKIPQGIQSGQTITIKNQGFHLINSDSKGDHILNVIVSVPKQLSEEEKKLYEKIRSLAKR